MKQLWIIVGILFCGLCCFANQPCEVRLLNGDYFQADYVGQTEAFAVFQVDWQKDPLRVHGKFIHTIDFGRKAAFPSGGWGVDLGNKERIYADLLSYDNQRFLLKPSWTESLKITSGYVSGLVKGIKENQSLYRGPNTIHEWTYRTVRGDFQDRSLSNATISSEGLLLTKPGGYFIDLPKATKSFGINIRFRFPSMSQWSIFGISVNFFKQENGLEQPLLINFQSNQFTIRVFDENQRRGQMRVAHSDVSLEKGRSYDLWIEFDREEKHLRIMFEDELLFDWEDSELVFSENLSPFELAFIIYRNNASSFLLEELFFYELENGIRRHPSPAVREVQGIEFVNGDFLPLHLQEIHENEDWVLQMPANRNTLKIDPSRIQSWSSSPEETYFIKRQANHIGLQLSGAGEYFIAELLSADLQKLVLQREGISGTFSLPFERVEIMRFNPYFTP